MQATLSECPLVYSSLASMLLVIAFSEPMNNSFKSPNSLPFSTKTAHPFATELNNLASGQSKSCLLILFIATISPITFSSWFILPSTVATAFSLPHNGTATILFMFSGQSYLKGESTSLSSSASLPSLSSFINLEYKIDDILSSISIRPEPATKVSFFSFSTTFFRRITMPSTRTMSVKLSHAICR